MLSEVGSILVGLAMAVAIYTAIAAFGSIRRGDNRWAESGRNGAYAVAGLLGPAVLLLLAAFLSNQFQIRYVAQHSSRDLPLYLKVSAVWAGQEGSLLLWSFLQALFTALAVGRPSERSRPLIPWATVFLSLITAFFVAITLFLSNPFALHDAVPADGQGLNPLLRHPGMVFHPPALYLGYVGLAVPFAFALAALAARRVEDWPAAARRWTLAAWLFLGLGLLLGARWAYDVLGWGGYWGWDPVENAGLMPWFTATALLHGIVMQGEKQGFRVWNIVLAVLSFVLVLFGTFTTRSGMVESVHAFSRSPLGYYFLAFMGLVVTVSVVLMVNAGQALRGQHSSDGLLSRSGMFFLTLILFLTITATIFIGSVLPTLTETLMGQRFEAGPEWFDRVTGPQLAALVLLIGVCPVLGRAASALRQLREGGWPALVGAGLVVAAAVLAGFTGWVPLIGFAVVGLAGGTILAEFARDVAARSRRQQENPLQALWHLVGRNRRRYGGYAVHIGVILMALGVIGTRMYEFETELVLSSGEPVDAGGYTLVFEDLRQDPAQDHFTTWASAAVYRDGVYVVTLQPQMNQYVGFEQTVAVPALRVGLWEDLYLVLAGWRDDGATVTLKVFVNPLASFLWLGGLIFLGGGAVAVWSQARAVRRSVPQARRRTIGAAAGLGVGILILIAAGAAMWGPGHGAVSQAAGRPLRGQTAPGFLLTLLDGSTLRLSDLRGGVAVINFWATWCPPCEEEMPDLEAVWKEYQGQGVKFIGIAFDEEEVDVQRMISRLGITYPQGMDVDLRIATTYGVTGVPETFIVDSEGRVAYVHIGPVNAGTLREELNSLLEGQ
jgi:cytochrome c-type biogenesis protein CcmF